MTIAYEIKDLFKLLWMKKKIIIIAAIICGLVAVPTATLSYKAALDNYNELMKKDTVEKSETPPLGTATYYLVLEVPSENNLPANVIINNVVALMNQDIIAKSAWENLNLKDKVTYPNFKSGLTITEMSGLPLIQIQYSSIEEDTFSLFVDQLIKSSIKIIPGIIHVNFELKKDSSFFEPPEKVEEFNINTVILQPPSKPHNYIKIIVTAGLAGIMFICFVILLLDFLKPYVKSKEDLINNYPCDVLNFDAVSEYLEKKNITAINIITIDQKLDINVLEKQLKERNMAIKTISCGNLRDVQDAGIYLLIVQQFISYHVDLFTCIENLPDDSYYSIVLL